MKLKQLIFGIAAAALTLVPATAMANDVNTSITLVGGTNYFGALHTDDADFTDVFTFNSVGEVIASASVITIGAGPNNIDFLSADLNGVPLTLSPTGFSETAVTASDLSLTGPLVLTITGRSGASGGVFASYAGTINVIPEPGTAMLMVIGLGGLASVGRRPRRRHVS